MASRRGKKVARVAYFSVVRGIARIENFSFFYSVLLQLQAVTVHSQLLSYSYYVRT